MHQEMQSKKKKKPERIVSLDEDVKDEAICTFHIKNA